MNIGTRIKNRRKQLGLTVDEVAEKLNKNRATVYRYESNDIENLPITILEPLAKVLNTTPAYLMGWKKESDNNIENKIEKDKLSNEEILLLENFNKLNDLGKNEANKRVSELTEINKYRKEIWDEDGKEDLMPIACHDDNLTEDEKNTMNSIIDNYIKNNK